MLPTYAVIVGMGGVRWRASASFNPAMLVHGGQQIELHHEIPPEGTVLTTRSGHRDLRQGFRRGGVDGVDFGRQGDRASRCSPPGTRRSSAAKAVGAAIAGRAVPSTKPPEREPDHVVSYTTRPDQALTYRLSGDRNPLHSDPQFAKMGGFDTPILHGLCTFGFTGRALLHSLCESDPSRFKTMDVRFSKPVYPGDTLNVKIWVDGDEAVFRTERGNGDFVIDQGRCTFVP